MVTKATPNMMDQGTRNVYRSENEREFLKRQTVAEVQKDIVIQWVKHAEGALYSILGKDILTIASGNVITFTEMSRGDKKETLYNATTELRGDGIHCLCTHGSLPCFAFSERCHLPRIFVLIYPTFEVIKTFESQTEVNYVTLRFSEMELLVALTGIPDFRIVIWNWRTSEKLYSQETKIHSPTQTLRVSPTSPVQILQATGMDYKMTCWDLHLCYKKTLLGKRNVQLRPPLAAPFGFTYGADGDIYIVDNLGCLFSMNPETLLYTRQYQFEDTAQTPNADHVPSVTWYKGGVVFNTPKDVCFLKKKFPEGWTRVWSVTPKKPFKHLLSSCTKDLLIGINVRNEVFIFKGDSQLECTNISTAGADFEFVDFVNPLGDYIITYGNKSKAFTIWKKSNGQKVICVHWQGGRINDLKSNPKCPYLLAATSDGIVHAISGYEVHSLTEVDQAWLTESSLDAIRFDYPGNAFCVANVEFGEFYLLKLPQKLEIDAHVKLDLKIVDYFLLEKEVSGVKLLVVPMSQLCCRSGQTILLFSLNLGKKTLEHVKDVSLPFVVTQILYWPHGHKEVLCVLHRSRKMAVLNFFDGKIIHEYATGHQMKLISVKSDGEFFLSYGADGLVIVKTVSKKCVTLFLTHHRLTMGIRSLAFDPYMTFVVARGENGSLVCVRLRHMGRESLRPINQALMLSPEYKQMFQHTTPFMKERPSAFGALESQTSVYKTLKKESLRSRREPWIIMRQEELENVVKMECQKEREGIKEEFLVIQEKVKDFIDLNLSNPPEKQLPIQAFDLDKWNRRKKLEDAKGEREKIKMLKMATMKSLSKLTEIIKTHCWDSMAVKGREIQGISANISVQSYALLPEDREFKQKGLWVAERKKMTLYFRAGDFFEPWVPMSESTLQLHLKNRFQLSALDMIQTLKTKYEDEQMEDDRSLTELEEQESPYVWSGTASHNFVDVDPLHYSQFELTTFLQSHQEIYFIENDIKKLMLWFNKEFAEMFASKEQEMAFVLEGNNRFRHIIDELNFFNFSQKICKTVIRDPEWAPEEHPESILTVQDHEVKVPLYLSPSEEEVLRKKREEEERLRLLLADDFRERALMTMMDGVLEKLWEDEIKKDVPKPRCMTDKDPENYTEEDLKNIKAYEEAVKFLASERERYRKILEGRWVKTIASVKDSISRFDEKVSKLHVLKLKVESAIGQEILKCLRIRCACFEKTEFHRRKYTTKVNITKNEKKIEEMTADLNKLTETLNDCKNYYETLQNKERNMDRNFKKEFPEYSSLVCEQLYKLSKKRPKLLQKTAAFSTVLIDLGKCAVSGTKPDYMPPECIQYLRDIETLDAFTNAPGVVSQQAWDLVCKMRRAKIETELKIRACAVDLADGEATVSHYQKKIKAAKEYNTQLQNELQNLRTEKTLSSLNREIQLVLKMGLVETPLTGQRSDFEDSVLVTKETLNQVNKAIQKVGEQKIKAMQKAANFRKGIIFKEWEHKKLRMEIEDLKEKLETIEKFQVLKELQAILTARARGFPDEKGFLYLENELAKVKEKFERAEVEIFSRIDRINQKILKLQKENKQLDKQIMEVNVEVNEMNLSVDETFGKKYMEENMRRMRKVRDRSRLVNKIQEQHNEILLLQTELELLRLRTYPAIKHKIS